MTLVTNVDTGKEYPSFCANAGSAFFAGESGLDCKGYYNAEKIPDAKEIKGEYIEFVQAYNYIEDHYGNLAENRVITQIVTWYLLGAIEVPSDDFNNIKWNEVETGTASVKGIPDAKAIVEAVVANYAGYVGSGKIVDVVFMVCENHEHSFATCQPQLVPVYGVSFNNEVKTVGSLAVSVDAETQYNEVTYQPIWQKTYQPIWQRVYQPIWQKTYQPIWQKEYQPYEVPQFEKKITSMSGTLVTRLTYSTTTASAVPTNGGAFGNGHTYVNIDIEKAKTEEGIWFPIADSSMNSNGKKTPAEYNKEIGYQYNVKIVNGEFRITFDDRLISASVGGYVVGAASVPSNNGNGNGNGNGKGNNGNGNGNGNLSPVGSVAERFPGNAPSHKTVATGGALVLDLPTADDNGVYYLYFHMEGLKYYTTGLYEFVGWKQRTPDELVADYFVRNDLVEDKLIENKLILDHLVYNKLVANEWVRDEFVNSELISIPYEGKFTLCITNLAGEEVYKNIVTVPLDVSLPNLPLGEYIVTLSGDDIADIVKTVEVKATEPAQVDFGVIIIEGTDVTINLPKIYDPVICIEKTYLKDFTLPKVYKPAFYNEKVYLDDITLPIISLGCTNPECPKSIANGIYTPARP